MRLQDGINLLRYAPKARRAAAYAAAHQLPGMEFDSFGRSLGRKLWFAQPRLGLDLIASPVNCVRYFEFSFAKSCLPEVDGRWLDVASPRLFSTCVASQRPHCKVTMINPDANDTHTSEAVRAAAGLTADRLELETADVVAFTAGAGVFDCIWSISVVEHISGAYDDSAAMAAMWAALKPGGRLIVTVPVMPVFTEEFRDRNPYGLTTSGSASAVRASGKGHFFQRLYDQEAIERRLVTPIGRKPDRMELWGERDPGWFAAYEARWKRQGLVITVDDARLMADHFTSYQSFATLRGLGVCGLLFSKPAAAADETGRKAPG